MTDQDLSTGTADEDEGYGANGTVMVDTTDEGVEQTELILTHSQLVLSLTRGSCCDGKASRRDSYNEKYGAKVGKKAAPRQLTPLQEKVAAANGILDSMNYNGTATANHNNNNNNNNINNNNINININNNDEDSTSDSSTQQVAVAASRQQKGDVAAVYGSSSTGSYRRDSSARHLPRQPSYVQPGAVHVSGMDEPTSVTRSIDEEIAHMRTELESTVTATVLEPGVLEEEIRQEILKETVEATFVQPEPLSPGQKTANGDEPTTPKPFWRRHLVKILVLILVILITVVTVTTIKVVNRDNGDDDGLPDQDEISYLQNLVVDQNTLEDPNSPQSRALQWISQDVKVEDGDLNYSRERFTLAILYYSLGGENWTRNDGWLTNTPECSWYLGTLPLEPPTCSMYTKAKVYMGIKTLRLNGNNLVGSIPPEIQNFAAVRFLDFQDNQITGPLPSTIFTIGLLELQLDGNYLTGPIPTPVWGTTKRAAATTTTFSGSITPRTYIGVRTSGGQNASGEVQTDDNESQFVGAGDDGGNGTDLESGLEVLTLSRNDFTGTIPTWLGDVTSLLVLDFHNNSLTGTLPTELATLNNLQVVRLEDNHLSGTIPSAYGDWTALNRSYFDHNKITGDMPSSICDLHPYRLAVDCLEVNCTCCSLCCYSVGRCKWTNATDLHSHPPWDDRNVLSTPMVER